MVTIGVFSEEHDSGAEGIVEAVEALGHNGTILHPSDIHLAVSDTTTLPSQLDGFVNWKIYTATAPTFDWVTTTRIIEQHVPTVNRTSAVIAASSKAVTADRLVQHEVPHPQTVYAPRADNLPTRDHEHVYKPNMDNGGSGVQRLQPQQTPPAGGLVQPYLPTSADNQWDYRVAVVNNEAVASYRRVAADDDFRTNSGAGGTIRLDQAPPEATTLAVDAAAAVDLDAAGVDIMKTSDGWTTIEVNAPFYLRGLWDAAQYNAAADIAALALERTGASVDQRALSDQQTHPLPTTDGSVHIDFSNHDNVTIRGETGTKSVPVCRRGSDSISISTALAGAIGCTTNGTTNGQLAANVTVVAGEKTREHTVVIDHEQAVPLVVPATTAST